MALNCAFGNNAGMDHATWISDGLKRTGKSQRELAAALGLDPSGVNRLIKGNRQLKASEVATVARFLGDAVDPSEIVPTADRRARPHRRPAAQAPGLFEISGTEVAAIPRYDAQLSAGAGSIIDPSAEPLGYQFVEAQWLRAVTRAMPEALAVVRVDGDSMAGTLADGDWILVDRSQNRINREGVYALAIGDSCWVKRISLNLREKTVRVISDNPAYPMQELTEDELTVIGRVVWIVGRKV